MMCVWRINIRTTKAVSVSSPGSPYWCAVRARERKRRRFKIKKRNPANGPPHDVLLWPINVTARCRGGHLICLSLALILHLTPRVTVCAWVENGALSATTFSLAFYRRRTSPAFISHGPYHVLVSTKIRAHGALDFLYRTPSNFMQKTGQRPYNGQIGAKLRATPMHSWQTRL